MRTLLLVVVLAGASLSAHVPEERALVVPILEFGANANVNANATSSGSLDVVLSIIKPLAQSTIETLKSVLVQVTGILSGMGDSVSKLVGDVVQTAMFIVVLVLQIVSSVAKCADQLVSGALQTLPGDLDATLSRVRAILSTVLEACK